MASADRFDAVPCGWALRWEARGPDALRAWVRMALHLDGKRSAPALLLRLSGPAVMTWRRVHHVNGTTLTRCKEPVDASALVSSHLL